MHRHSWRGAGLKALLLGALAVGSVALPAVAQRSVTVRTWDPQLDGAYLGIEMEEVTAENIAAYKLGHERGVIVKAVEKGSPAEAAGLQPKDVILEYSGTAVFSTAQFGRLVRETPVGRAVELGISRDGKKITLPAKVGKREGEPGMPRRGMVVVPGDEAERHFEFRVPGPEHFEFRSPDGGWRSFGLPPGGSYRYSHARPRLGVTLQSLTDQMAEFLGVPGKKGVVVTSVAEGSAASGKLKAGDVVVKADEAVISEPQDLVEAVQKKEKNGKIDLVIVRDKKQITVSVVLPGEESRDTKGGYRL